MLSKSLVMTLLATLLACGNASQTRTDTGSRVPVIFDTDIGNDIDDALALAMLHVYSDLGQVTLLAVTISKDNEMAAPFASLVNTFYGRPALPIGVVRRGKTTDEGKYLRPLLEKRRNGRLVYPRQLHSGREAPEAVELQRRILVGQPDCSVVFVVVGFSTNIVRLLESLPDEHSTLNGSDLVRRKVRLLSIMAGMYSEPRQREYNVYTDLPAAQRLFKNWPTPIVVSGYEIGEAIRYPASSIEHDFKYVSHHPISDAYRLYMEMPYDRQCWDLTSVLFAVEPEADYFGLSPPGSIHVDSTGLTHFEPGPSGLHRYLVLATDEIVTVRQRLVDLVSKAPKSLHR